MHPATDRLIIPVGILVAFIAVMLALFQLGRRVGRRFRGRNGVTEGVAIIDAAVFALMGLLIGFQYSGASSRFEDRRKLIIEEADAIGTAYLRIDTVEESAQPKLREDFRRYLDARLAVYQHIDDVPTAKRDAANAEAIQGIIWKDAIDAVARSKSAAAAMVFLPAVNSMFDIATLRTAVVTFHPPEIVIVMLVVVAFVCSVLAGFEMGGSSVISRLHVVGFVVILAVTLYAALDMEYPRRGLVRVDATDVFMFHLRDLMK